jgi:hypothetical protein
MITRGTYHIDGDQTQVNDHEVDLVSYNHRCRVSYFVPLEKPQRRGVVEQEHGRSLAQITQAYHYSAGAF